MQSIKHSIAACRLGLAAAALLFIAACQTVAQPGVPFTPEQAETLERAGFVREGDAYLLGIPDRLLFPFDSNELMAEKAIMLTRMAKALSDVGIGGAKVEGHADAIGRPEYNQALSFRRAETVMRALVAGGMQLSAMKVVGRGEADPIDSNETEEGRSQNRRVVIIVTPADAIPLLSG